MTKQEFIELIRFDICGGYPTPEAKKKYPDSVISAKCNEVYKAMLNEIYLTTKKARDYSVFDNYSKRFKIKILYDKERDMYYSNFPASIVSMPLEIAVVKISPLKDRKTSFIPIRANEVELYAGLPGSVGQIFFFEDNREIAYYNLSVDFNEQEVDARLVINFHDYDIKDRINTPTGTQGTMFERVLALMRGQQMTPQKQVNDNQDPVYGK